jgi:hypothetical protein
MDPLTGNLATLGCCKKVMHVECLVKCMATKLSCPMCRTEHQSLSVVQNIETNIFVNSPTNRKFFRDALLCTAVTSVISLSCGGYFY